MSDFTRKQLEILARDLNKVIIEGKKLLKMIKTEQKLTKNKKKKLKKTKKRR